MSRSLPLTTTTVLLDALHAPGNDSAWAIFDERYRPIITRFVARLGLDEADASEVAQQTLIDLLRALRAGRYERGKGRLRSWVIRVAQNRAMDFFRERARGRVQRGESAFTGALAEDQAAEIWDLEQQRAVLREALQVLRTRTRITEPSIQAFELVLRGVPTAEAARQCGMSEAEVYVAKNRVATRLRSIVAELARAYEEDG